MPNKAQERFLMREFRRWLANRVSDVPIRWRSEKADPPDFWLWLGSRRFAVEVTNVLNERDRAVTAALWRVAEEVERTLTVAGQLSGRYVVTFRGPLDRGKHLNVLRSQLEDVIRTSADTQAPFSRCISIAGKVVCDVEKFADDGLALYPAGGGITEGGWATEIGNQLQELLRAGISTKARKLRPIGCPIILILYDLFGLADRPLFRECVRGVPEVEQFHCIYVVQDVGAGFAAITPDEWMKGAARGEASVDSGRRASGRRR